MKMLEGPMETLLDGAWHPNANMMATVSEYGFVYIWTVKYTENWSAFAPGKLIALTNL